MEAQVIPHQMVSIWGTGRTVIFIASIKIWTYYCWYKWYERLRITSDGKFGFNTTSPAGQVHIKGNTDGESANPSIILDDNGDARRCYVTNSALRRFVVRWY